MDIIFDKLKIFFEKEVGIKTRGNADFWHGKFATLSIDEARNIAELQERKSAGGGKKIFIISAESITEEAQNALLKVLEEPTSETHFFILSPQDTLLPTLRSRLHSISVEAWLPQMPKRHFDILEMKMKDRLAKVKEITDAISEAKSSDSSIARPAEDGFREKTKQDAIDFINQVEIELYQKLHHISKTTRFDLVKGLEVTIKARQALYDRGAPVKMILENVVLSI